MNTEDIGYWMHMLSVKIKASVDELLKKYKITYSQSKVLFLICDKEKPMTQKEIKNQLFVAHTTVLGIIKRLYKNGFVTVETDESDKRSTLIRPTEKAMEIYHQVKAGSEKYGSEVMKGFSQEEIDSLIDLLKRLYINIEKIK